MDRQTLVNYGWIVIAALVIAIMLALATPFGKYVMDGVSSVASGYINASNNAMNDSNMSQIELEWTLKTYYGPGYDSLNYYRDLKTAVDNLYSNQGDKTENDNCIAVATGNGKTPIVKLIKDTTSTETVEIDESFILDINKKTLTIECDTGFKILNDINFVIKNSGKIIQNTVEESTNRMFNTQDANNYSILFEGGEYMLNFDKGINAILVYGYVTDGKSGVNNITAKNCKFTFKSQKQELAEEYTNAIFYTDVSETLLFDNCSFNANTTNVPIMALVYARGNNTITNCTFNINSVDSRVYSLYNSSTSEVNNCTFTTTQTNATSNTYGIYNKNIMTLNNCNVTISLPNSSSHNSGYCVLNSDGEMSINGGTYNIYAEHDAYCIFGISNSKGHVNANNINVIAESINTSISSGEEESSNSINEHYVYAMRVTGGGILTVTNSNILTKATDVQPSCFRLQNASTVNISNVTMESKLTRVAPPNGEMGIDRYMREYVIFSNYNPVNTVNIDNSYIKGYYAFYKGTTKNVFNVGDNMQYDSSVIFINN